MSKHCCPSTHKQKVTDYFVEIVLISLLIIMYTLFLYNINTLWLKHFLSYGREFLFPALLGLLLGGLIAYIIPDEFVHFALVSHKTRTLFYAFFIGSLFSLCSHGILFIAIQLRKKGASCASILVMLLAAPWANITMLCVLVKFLQIKALFIVIGAFFVAIITGIIVQYLEKKDKLDKYTDKIDEISFNDIYFIVKHNISNHSWTIKQLIKDIIQIIKESLNIAKQMLVWLLLGLVITALVKAFFHESLLWNYFKGNCMGMFSTLMLASIMEVCSEGLLPLALELHKQTLALGNVFLFLLAGVATDYTEIMLLWKNIGKRTALILPILSIPQILLFAWIMNKFF